jgi:uncharacterized protein YdiU (UPF0061 family)
LSRLAEALLPLIDPVQERAVELATAAVQAFQQHFLAHWSSILRTKLGLPDGGAAADQLVADFLALLHEHKVDYTLGWRHLGDAAAGAEEALRGLFGAKATALDGWLPRWRAMFGTTPGPQKALAMAAVNPAVIPRNHQVEQALGAASEQQDLRPFEQLLEEVSRPFEAREPGHAFTLPAPPEQTACYQTFCGT